MDVKKLLTASALLCACNLLPLCGQTIMTPEFDISSAKKRGEVFESAYQLFLNAPAKNYNYEPARIAFAKFLEKNDEKSSIDAAYFLCLCDFLSLRFEEAFKQSSLLLDKMRKSRPDDVETMIASKIYDAAVNGSMKNIEQLKKLVSDYSYFKVIMPGADEKKLLGASSTFAVLSYIDLLEKMRESAIYENAKKRLADLNEIALSEDRKPVVSQLKKHIAELKACSDCEFIATIGILAIESERLSKEFPDLKNNIGKAICAHNLKQLGIAFHLYILENGIFPPLRETKQGKLKGKDVDVDELWVDKLKPYLGIDEGTVLKHYGVYRTMPEKSPFQCPAALKPMTITSQVQYAYNCMYPFAYVKKVESNLGSGTVKYSMIKPEKHLLLCDAWYFGSKDGRGIARLYTQGVINPRHKGYVNVLYADGHVVAENINWLWESDGDGTPWDSNKPYRKSVKIPVWNQEILEIEQ